ncbi:hypothetical protein Vretifemale_20689, partial [Volvox reticuliferus]
MQIKKNMLSDVSDACIYVHHIHIYGYDICLYMFGWHKVHSRRDSKHKRGRHFHREVVHRLQPQQQIRMEDRMQQQLQAPPDCTTVMAMIVRWLGWRLPGDSGIVPFYHLTVSQATQLQGGSTTEERLELLTAFVREALGVSTDSPTPPYLA